MAYQSNTKKEDANLSRSRIINLNGKKVNCYVPDSLLEEQNE